MAEGMGGAEGGGDAREAIGAGHGRAGDGVASGGGGPDADLALCRREMAEAERTHGQRAWLIALWWLDWHAEERLIHEERAASKGLPVELERQAGGMPPLREDILG